MLSYGTYINATVQHACGPELYSGARKAAARPRRRHRVTETWCLKTFDAAAGLDEIIVPIRLHVIAFNQAFQAVGGL